MLLGPIVTSCMEKFVVFLYLIDMMGICICSSTRLLFWSCHFILLLCLTWSYQTQSHDRLTLEVVHVCTDMGRSALLSELWPPWTLYKAPDLVSLQSMTTNHPASVSTWFNWFILCEYFINCMYISLFYNLCAFLWFYCCSTSLQMKTSPQWLHEFRQ